MLTEQDMLEIADKYITHLNNERENKLIVLHEFTIRKPYGFVFFYNSKKYIETEDFKYVIAGNGPFLVENKEGLLYKFGTSESVEYSIKEYEEGNWEPGTNGIWNYKTDSLG
jgi:hypothetical protein